MIDRSLMDSPDALLWGGSTPTEPFIDAPSLLLTLFLWVPIVGRRQHAGSTPAARSGDMKLNIKIYIFAFSLMSVLAIHSAMAKGRGAVDLSGHEISFRSEGLAEPGTPIHAWIKLHASNVQDDVPVVYAFSFRNADASSAMAVMNDIHSYKSTQAKNIEFDPPPPPGFTPPTVGSKSETSVCSYPVKFNSDFGYADMEFKWEYRYTKDTDNDGKNDSDPKWVLTSFSASNIALDVMFPPIAC